MKKWQLQQFITFYSLFVHLPGRTKDEAFRIGNEIAQAVTDMNPKPIKLKFEKVVLFTGYLINTLYVTGAGL